MKRLVNKKGQIALFVIIAILLVGSIFIFLIFRGNLKLQSSGRVDNEVREIDDFIDSCIEQRAIDAIRLVGLQGGYVSLPEDEDYLETVISNMGYGVYSGKKTLPSKSKIEEEIAGYIRTSIVFCLDDREFGFEVKQKNAEANVKIKDDYVKISAKLPIFATKGDNTFMIDREYEKEISIRLGEIYEVADALAEKAIEEPESIDLTYITSLKFNIVFVPVDEETIIYTIIDENHGDFYTFVYAHKLNIKKDG